VLRGCRTLALLALALILVLPVALTACAGGENSIKGQVTSVDATGRTFSVQTEDGKQYDFIVPEGSTKVDLTHIKEHMDQKRVIEVKYTGETSPYESTYAH
jgi:hypothetical protein